MLFRSKASVDPLPDQAALKLSDGHEDAQLKPSSRVVAAGIDALGGADEGDAQPLKLVQDEGQVGEAAAKSVQLVDDHPGHLAGPDLAHHGVQLRPSDFCTGLTLDEEPGS